MLLENGFEYVEIGILEFFGVIVDEIIGFIIICVIIFNLNEVLLSGMFVCVCLDEGVCFDVLLVF